MKLSVSIPCIILLCACRPSPVPSGTGGGPNTSTVSSTSASSGGDDGGGMPICEAPRHRKEPCVLDSDCNTGSNLCEAWYCVAGKCAYRQKPIGTRCDPGVHGQWHWVCGDLGQCCPMPPTEGR